MQNIVGELLVKTSRDSEDEAAGRDVPSQVMRSLSSKVLKDSPFHVKLEPRETT